MTHGTWDYLFKKTWTTTQYVVESFRFKDENTKILAVPRTPSWRDVPRILAGRFRPSMTVLVDEAEVEHNPVFLWGNDYEIPERRPTLKDIVGLCPLSKEERLEDYKKRQTGSDHGVSTLLERYAVAQLAGILAPPDTK